jgi:hypothetical protein
MSNKLVFHCRIAGGVIGGLVLIVVISVIVGVVCSRRNAARSGGNAMVMRGRYTRTQWCWPSISIICFAWNHSFTRRIYQQFPLFTLHKHLSLYWNPSTAHLLYTVPSPISGKWICRGSDFLLRCLNLYKHLGPNLVYVWYFDAMLG